MSLGVGSFFKFIISSSNELPDGSRHIGIDLVGGICFCFLECHQIRLAEVAGKESSLCSEWKRRIPLNLEPNAGTIL